MKHLFLFILIVCSLNVSAQKKPDYNKVAQAAQQMTDSTLLTYKAKVETYNAFINKLEQLKAVMVLFKSPYEEVAIIDQLINSIYQQVVPQIKK